VAWAVAQRESGKADTAGQAAFAIDEREAIALSCGMIAMIDDAIGRVLGRLAACGLADTPSSYSQPTTAIFSGTIAEPSPSEYCDIVKTSTRSYSE